MLSGGSAVSSSATWAASTVTVHDSADANSVDESSVKLVGPPLTVAVCEPLFAHATVNQLPITLTGSLKVTVIVASSATLVAFGAGAVAITNGATSPSAPSPPNVSTAKPSHSSAGSNESLGLVSPALTLDLLRSVLSAVLTRPVPHSVPGSKPTWPIESIIVVPLRSTTASSPLNQPAPFV